VRSFLIAAFCAAIVVGASAVVIAVFVGIGGSGTSIFELEAGECFQLPEFDDDESRPTQALLEVEPVDCDEAHTAEVLLTGRLNPDQSRPYPSDDALFAEIGEHCRGLRAASDELGFGVLPVAPNESSWEPRGGRLLCLAIPYGGEPRAGSITARVTDTVAGDVAGPGGSAPDAPVTSSLPGD
jgi:hypothetical protein